LCKASVYEGANHHCEVFPSPHERHLLVAHHELNRCTTLLSAQSVSASRRWLSKSALRTNGKRSHRVNNTPTRQSGHVQSFDLTAKKHALNGTSKPSSTAQV
jgi:hypothetical protein